jgi:hypothetical protein
MDMLERRGELAGRGIDGSTATNTLGRLRMEREEGSEEGLGFQGRVGLLGVALIHPGTRGMADTSSIHVGDALGIDTAREQVGGGRQARVGSALRL